MQVTNEYDVSGKRMVLRNNAIMLNERSTQQSRITGRTTSRHINLLVLCLLTLEVSLGDRPRKFRQLVPPYFIFAKYVMEFDHK